ncbi:MAG: TonB-dependent receptor [Balneolaceae bacterium]|nr:MAG: TonB-dependent receptor [Balneolaceae bacterium]
MSALSYLIISLAFLYATETETGPAGSIDGIVFNDENKTLAYAHVALPELNKGTITRRDGTFSLDNVPVGEYRILISHVGYQTADELVAISDGQLTELRITLRASNEMPSVEIVGRAPGRLARVPGSAAVVTAERLEETNPVSATEIFREIPGINAINHDPIGLRTNIGIRGLDPDMSRNVLMLEDGIPVALAPYGEPEMYYSPSISRMSGVEVIKGSGSIMYGPRTIGGVINFLTADPPAEPTLDAHVTGGENGYLTSRIGYGNTVGNSGFQVTYLHRRADNIGPLNFHLNDLNARWKLVMGQRSVLGVKMSIYDELSNATYVGLTQPMFESGLYDFKQLAPDDELDVRRYSASISHDYFFSDHVHLRTTAYAYTTRRNWSRQDFDNQPAAGREYRRVAGNPDEPFGAIWFREGTGNRNREFEVVGFEPRISARYHLGEHRNELDAGFRYLYERAFEQRVNGIIDSPATGNIRDDEIRTGYATSAFVQNRFYATPQLTATPGLRVEYFRYERDILRVNFEDVQRSSNDEVLAFIPGLGFNFQMGPESAIFTGVHRGFSPPRVKDALTATGSSEELDAEWSWSYEAGFRLRPLPFFTSEITGYYMSFENQIIPVSESSGGQGMPNAVGLTNGGATRHHGVEFLFRLDPDFAGRPLSARLELGGTWNQASFSEDRFVTSGGEIVNIKGNDLPYAPEWSGFTRLSASHTSGFSGFLKATYTGEQFGDVLNRTESTGNGRDGMLDSYTVVDAGMRYRLPVAFDASLSLSVKNLTDERYIASRRPQGIRVGLPRMFMFGLSVTL